MKHGTKVIGDNRVLLFAEWFRSSVVMVYAERIPDTIESICQALEVDEPMVDLYLKHVKSRQAMLKRVETGLRPDEEMKQESPLNEVEPNGASSLGLTTTLSQLISSKKASNTVANADAKMSTVRKRKLDQTEIVKLSD